MVDLCQEADLVRGRELFFDATKIQANADLDSLVPRFFHAAKAHLAEVFADAAPTAVTESAEAMRDDLPTKIRLLQHEPPGRGAPASDARPWRLLEERRLDPQRPSSGSYRRTSDFRVSTTDADATPMRTGSGTSLGYHDHYVVDGSRHRIILAALVTPADGMENVPMRDLLWRVCFRRKLRPQQVTGDTTYGTTENIVAVEDAGIRAFFPLPNFDRRTPFFGRDAFVYDAEADVYRCPQGQSLRRRTIKYTEQEVVYQARAATCNTCLIKAACTASNHGRSVHRSLYEDYLDRVRGEYATEAYKQAMRKRQVWVEPLFAEAKEWHGLRRLRLRGLLNANIQGLLIAAGQNLKRLLAATGWGRRHAPSGSLLALPKEPRSLPAGYG